MEQSSSMWNLVVESSQLQVWQSAQLAIELQSVVLLPLVHFSKDQQAMLCWLTCIKLCKTQVVATMDSILRQPICLRSIHL